MDTSILVLTARWKTGFIDRLQASTHSLDDDSLVHSFSTLIAEMATIARNTCRTPNAAQSTPTFTVHTSANLKQKHALELIGQIAL